jgi:hypothetical protein
MMVTMRRMPITRSGSILGPFAAGPKMTDGPDSDEFGPHGGRIGDWSMERDSGAGAFTRNAGSRLLHGRDRRAQYQSSRPLAIDPAVQSPH